MFLKERNIENNFENNLKIFWVYSHTWIKLARYGILILEKSFHYLLAFSHATEKYNTVLIPSLWISPVTQTPYLTIYSDRDQTRCPPSLFLTRPNLWALPLPILVQFYQESCWVRSSVKIKFLISAVAFDHFWYLINFLSLWYRLGLLSAIILSSWFRQNPSLLLMFPLSNFPSTYPHPAPRLQSPAFPCWFRVIPISIPYYKTPL